MRSSLLLAAAARRLAVGVHGQACLGRAAVRQATKFLPWVGSLAGGAYAFGSTYAIGRSACWYYGEILKGHVPHRDEVREVLGGAFETARKLWQSSPPGKPSPTSESPA